ncbi:MAG: nucleotide-binding protein [bacterium]|nr:nucleotide-binding protein [bacterium]
MQGFLGTHGENGEVMKGISSKIEELIDAAWNSAKNSDYRAWENRTYAFLASGIDDSTAKVFRKLGEESFSETWTSCRERQVGHLEGLAVKASYQGLANSSSGAASAAHATAQQTKKVFIVHGHDNEAKETVARFLERLRLQPVILHEKPNAGRTIIEKFEVFSDVGYAVVLLTPDDMCIPVASQQKPTPRARQNVILELGYFMGKLSRFRVCALYKKGVDIPSDYQGVLYIEMDQPGAWRQKLAQELVEANLPIDLDGLIHS